ncbi:MAG: Ig domain-containing protein, partial [Prosthecobacter sp.]
MNPTTLHSLRRMARIVIAAMLTFSVSDVLAVPAVAPVLTPFSPETNGVVSGEVNRQLAFTGTATSFAATGLPRGVTLNTRTGLITGRPLVSGNFTLIFTAWNGPAKSAPLTVYWTVEPLPAGTAGSYNALLDRQDWLNGGYGGSLRLTVNADGTYSGVINRGYHSNRIVGQLETQPGGVAPIGEFSVPRRSPYVPLQFAFVLPIGTGQISGVLSEPDGFSANLSGFRAAYSASRPATAFAGRWNTGYELP